MKILIIGFTKIKFMPYLNFYFDNIDEHHAVDILYWNRDLKPEALARFERASLHEFQYKLSDEDRYSKKIAAFIRFRKYAKKLLRETKYDYIIVLHSLPAVLLRDVLGKQYCNRYIFDYRDSTYERFSWFQSAVNELTRKSRYTFVSSAGFLRYLPQSEREKILISHNLLIDSLSHREDAEVCHVRSEKIRIAFWGFIRHKEVNMTLIDAIGKDHRFELHYYGRELETAEELKQHVSARAYKNIFFHGEYSPEDRYTFIRETDLIHNIYFDTNTMLAMGNKYYDGLIFRIPQLCMVGSYMGKLCTENHVGLECDPAWESFCDDVYAYYQKTRQTYEIFKACCDKQTEDILLEYQTGCRTIRHLGEW